MVAHKSVKDGSPPRLVVVTGMSGAGKSVALQALEDAGFETVDNLPVALINAVVAANDDHSIAVGVDVRTRDFDAPRLLSVIENIRQNTRMDVGLMFLDADTDVITRRYTESRRPHPLAPERRVSDGIELERQLLAPLRESGGLLIDTSHLLSADLKRIVQGQFGGTGTRPMQIFLMSFGYKNGLPRDADLVLDVRFLKNPHYDQALRPLTGLDPEVGGVYQRRPCI